MVKFVVYSPSAMGYYCGPNEFCYDPEPENAVLYPTKDRAMKVAEKANPGFNAMVVEINIKAEFIAEYFLNEVEL